MSEPDEYVMMARMTLDYPEYYLPLSAVLRLLENLANRSKIKSIDAKSSFVKY